MQPRGYFEPYLHASFLGRGDGRRGPRSHAPCVLEKFVMQCTASCPRPGVEEKYGKYYRTAGKRRQCSSGPSSWMNCQGRAGPTVETCYTR